MKNKGLWITMIVLIVVIGVAAVLYPKLSAGMQTGQLATATEASTVPTTPEAVTEPAATEAATEPTAATEAAQETGEEPETVPAPDLTLLDWDGNEVHLSDYIGKPMVLNFWAHWCGPCQMEMPEFNAVYEELEGEVTFLMVHMGAAVDKGKEKVTEGGYTFPVVFDTDSTAGYIYGATAYPTSFFIDADGNIQAYYVGMMDRSLLQQGIDLIYTAE